ncbi:MAG: MoaD/ThiS family protein [Hyphomonadaceae bacterium]|nr:MoaD/ThiS family protein [Hyphomonadaceae bacterium]
MTRLLFFGRLRDVAGCSERLVDLPSNIGTVAELRAWIGEGDPNLGAALETRGVHVAVDQVICNRATEAVRGAGEIAFMPPLSGG